MTRPYRLGLRQERVDQSRARILVAARDLVVRTGFHGAGLEQVALVAGVARQTVYYQFGSKLGLLDALATELEAAAGIPGQVQEVLAGPTRAALEEYMSIVCHFWARNQDLVRAWQSMAQLDSKIRKIGERHEMSRHARMVAFVDQMAERGELREDYSRAQGVDLLWLLTSFNSFDHLLSWSHLSVGAAARLLADAAAVILR
jgi:AcrR family transcriptional regulator